MTTYKILITGGAGFIGTHLAKKLNSQGHEVTVFDSLEDQIHRGKKPKFSSDIKFIQGNVLNKFVLLPELRNADIVFHEAAQVGLGQSMYMIDKYTENNVTGTARLLDLIVNNETKVKRIIVAGSVASYGEGTYWCQKCEYEQYPKPRKEIKNEFWGFHCESCGLELDPRPIAEDKPLTCNSVYGLNKKSQEELVLMIGETYGIDVISTRYFNVMGPGQSISNPYTGVIAMFLSRLKAGNEPLIYEDGQQQRDFVSVHDVVDANILAMNAKYIKNEVFNIGSGKATTIEQAACYLSEQLGVGILPHITKQFRKGDSRNLIADISKAERLLGFKPKHSFRDILIETVEWAKKTKSKDLFHGAYNELYDKGLVV